MKEVDLPGDLFPLEDDDMTVFEDDDTESPSVMVVTPNQWGTETRDGVIALVLYNKEDGEMVGFKIHVNDTDKLVDAINRAAKASV